MTKFMLSKGDADTGIVSRGAVAGDETKGTGSGGVLPEHRPVVIPLVIRVLFGKLLMRKGNTSKAKYR